MTKGSIRKLQFNKVSVLVSEKIGISTYIRTVSNAWRHPTKNKPQF